MAPWFRRKRSHLFFLHFFESFYKIRPIQVHLPNGNSVLVNFASNFQFSPNLYITNVLYSPGFALNLIPISKSCQSLSCTIQLTNVVCHIQYMKHLKMIGLKEHINGFYQLKMDTKPTYLHKLAIPNTMNNANTIETSPCNFSIPIYVIFMEF